MAQSLNTKVDLTAKASFFGGLTSTGSIMIGDRAFEFYDVRNVEKCIQIPWEEVDRVEASVLFKGKNISRFVIFTKSGRHYSFSARENKKTLRAVAKYISGDRMLRSLSFFDVFKRGLMYFPNRILHKNKPVD